MKTLQQIKDEYVRELEDFSSWADYRNFNEIYDSDLEEISKRYAREVAREALKNASENAEVDVIDYNDYDVNKQSILDEKNMPI